MVFVKYCPIRRLRKFSEFWMWSWTNLKWVILCTLKFVHLYSIFSPLYRKKKLWKPEQKSDNIFRTLYSLISSGWPTADRQYALSLSPPSPPGAPAHPYQEYWWKVPFGSIIAGTRRVNTGAIGGGSAEKRVIGEQRAVPAGGWGQ